MEVILISGIFMSFFIAFLLLTKKEKALTDRILAAWVVIIGIHLLGYYYNQLGYWEKYPHLIGVTAPFPLLHGPMLFLYTLYSLRKDNKIRLKDYLHFAPAVVAYLYMFNFFFFYSAEEKSMIDKGEIPDYGLFAVILVAASLISGLTYSILAYRLTLKHERKIENNFSYNEGINLTWVRYCILGIGFWFLLATIITVLRQVMGVEFSFNADYIFYSLLIVFIFYFGYFGIRHENIFINNPQIVHKAPLQEELAQKYKHSGLKKEVAKQIHDRLLEMMNKEKPFLEPKLTLAGLAALIDTTPNQLSQVINQYEKVNFHDFVNKFRVEEFIKKAHQNKDFSLLGLALDSGFNSKSSFNNVFKKHKGLTPSKFLAKQVQNHRE